MTGTSARLTPEQDAANLLLLWLLIHGGDPAGHDSDDPISVSAEAYSAAVALVTTLSDEFSATRLDDLGQVAARMQEQFTIQTLPAGDPGHVIVYPPRVFCLRFGDVTVCFVVRPGPDTP